MLCHRQAIPSISSYSASPLRQRRTKTPSRFHSKKYLWTELALPNTSSGKAFHWHPVRRTYTMAAKTLRGAMGFRPPPGRRRYFRFFLRLRLGIRGSTRFHSSSDTVHDLIALMAYVYHERLLNVNIYLRISSKGEIGLQEFCKRNSIVFRRISKSKEQTPDYELTIGDTKVIAEVKDIEMNDEERDVQQKMKIGQMQVWGSSKVGSRVRDAVSKANKQLKKFTHGNIHGILVLFDSRPFPFNILYPYEIKVAMYGFETFDLSVSKDFSPPAIMGRRFGKGKKCTPYHNTSTSAVTVLEFDKQTKEYQLMIYHNKFSAVPLPPTCWGTIDAVKQFAIKQNITDEFGDWESI
jgi:hypothetical protein